ncbi:MAG: HD domain-containing protein [Oscillospiraceae bacterium]|nr:HD domain-containing protein [Oscillospiraceae bacterium]
MQIPHAVRNCIDALESAGFSAYLVGGCVRDAYLGLTPHDFDLCTPALPEQTEAVFSTCKLVLAGKKHGTIGVVTEAGVVEITTFRTEGGYADNRHPEWVRFVPNIEDDLARRDFTVNAMAYSPARGFADPFGGRKDLDGHILRAVGDPAARFEEDSLRILRGIRFAVKYHLCVEKNTLDAMLRLAPLMENLAQERIFEEVNRFLLHAQAEALLTFAPVLTVVLPELAPLIGFDQHSSHHAYDVYTHTAHVTEAVPSVLALRWAALLHDTGKPATFTVDEAGQGHFYAHAEESAAIADVVLHRLKAPTALREEVVLLIAQHMTRIEPDKRILRRRLNRFGAETLEKLLLLQEADMGSKGTGKPAEMTQFAEIRRILSEIEAENACLSLKELAVNGHDLMALGITGRQIGLTLNRLLELVMDETVPNEKNALLDAARRISEMVN